MPRIIVVECYTGKPVLPQVAEYLYIEEDVLDKDFGVNLVDHLMYIYLVLVKEQGEKIEPNNCFDDRFMTYSDWDY